MAQTGLTHVASLKSVTKVMEELESNDEKTIGVHNITRIGGHLQFTLAWVATSRNPKSNVAPFRKLRKTFDLTEFHPEEKDAIGNFLQFQAQFDLQKKEFARSLTEIYVTTRSFTKIQWKWLTQLLVNFCQDSLKNLWLRDVDFDEYHKGTSWMENLPGYNDQEGQGQSQSQLSKSMFRFPKLTTFIWQGVYGSGYLSRKTLHLILLLLKPLDRPLEALWSTNRREVQIWDQSFCDLFMDPAKSSLWVGDVTNKLRGEIGSKIVKMIPIAKIYLKNLNYDFSSKGPFKPQWLTHLCLDWDRADSEFISEVISALPSFKLLQKLALWGYAISTDDTDDDDDDDDETGSDEGEEDRWTMDLETLSGLDNLSFLSLKCAQVNCGGVGVNQFPWQPSVQTIVLLDCDFKVKGQGPVVLHLNDSLQLDRTQWPFEIKSFTNCKKPRIDTIMDSDDDDERMSEGEEEEEDGDEETKVRMMMIKDFIN